MSQGSSSSNQAVSVFIWGANEDEEVVSGQQFVVLADYMALTSREIDLNEDEVVELIKVGCAGWWYVRITTYPYPEGWAPSTYLEKMTT